MKFESIPAGIPKTQEDGGSKIFKRASEIIKNTPQKHLPQIISELEQYVKLRTLNETRFEDLPEELRKEIGTGDPMDEFIERVNNFDQWDLLTDEYGFTPDSNEPKYTINDINELIAELKNHK